jgi:hydroxymethylglutaryl-CoA lyase
MAEPIQLVECPRDAWQGKTDIIPTAQKVLYLQSLLAVGFHTLDAGSFVSSKAVPQLADTSAVLRSLDLRDTNTRLLVILANERGADQASEHPFISYWGYPLSVSETFQQRNTRQTIPEGIEVAKRLQERAIRSSASLVVYISMGFGNPYGESYHSDQVLALADTLQSAGVETISLADTVGVSWFLSVKKSFHRFVGEFICTPARRDKEKKSRLLTRRGVDGSMEPSAVMAVAPLPKMKWSGTSTPMH